MKVSFNEYKTIFTRTKNVYPETKGLDIELRFKKDIFFTMRGSVSVGVSRENYESFT